MEHEISLNLPFLLAGIIIFIGFFGTLFFQKTRIPDVLFLIIIGVLLGPIAGWIKAVDLENITPYFGRLALIIILFEGGLHLRFDSLIKNLVGGVGLCVGVFAVTVVGIWAVGEYVLGMTTLNALMLGCILGATSSAIVIPLANTMTIREETRSILNLEAILADIIMVIGVIILIEITLMGEVKPTAILNAIAGSFSIALVAGIVVGLIWIKALASVKVTPLSYMTTLAMVLIIYGVVEMCKGSGAVAAFTFGLVLRNGTRFLRVFDDTKTFTLDTKIEQFHGEFTFFVRTYFFVYLGLLFTPQVFEPAIIKAVGLVCCVFIMTRYIYLWFFSAVHKPIKAERFTFFVMLPRGLATAVVASLPAAAHIAGTENFMTYAMLAILLSNIFMVVGIFITERQALHNGNQKPQSPPPKPSPSVRISDQL